MEGQKEYVIRKITNKRILRGEVEYFVSWEGYPESEDSWEPKSGLTDAMEAIYEYERSLLKNEARSSPTASEPVEDAPSPYKVRRSFERGSWRFGVLQSVPDKMEQERLQVSSMTSKKAPCCESTDESTDSANNDCAEVTKRHKSRRRSREQQPPPVPASTSATVAKTTSPVVPLAVFKSPFDASTRDRQPQNRKRPHEQD